MTWKKPLAAVLAGMLCIISMPQVQPLLPVFSAAAAEETGTVGALTYTLKSDRAIITQCDKNAEEVEIPSEIAGKPVLQIAERAFLSHEKLTRVVIPDTVRTIENLAFSHCSQLQEVTLPKYLVTIGSNCFSYCAQLEELDVPKTVKNIGHSAFYGTAWLKQKQSHGQKIFHWLECIILRDIFLQIISNIRILNHRLYALLHLVDTHILCA